MKKALDIYTALNEMKVRLMEGKATPKEVHDVIAEANTFINTMKDGEKKEVLVDMVESVKEIA